MKTIWFRQYGWIYIPVHYAGLLITLLAIIFMVPGCIAIIRNGHSAGNDLYQVFVYITCTAFWWKWIADKTSV